MRSKKRKSKHTGIFFMILGAALIISGLVLFAGNHVEEKKAGESAEKLLSVAEEKIQKVNLPLELPGEDENSREAAEEKKPSIEELYNLDGILTVPQLSLRLPVIADYSDELLKVSICVFERSEVDGQERKVIAGHNYRYHFGKLPLLKVGAEVFYEDMQGEKTRYQVINTEEIDAEDYASLDDGSWDVTLLTCNKDMKKRILVRLQKA